MIFDLQERIKIFFWDGASPTAANVRNLCIEPEAHQPPAERCNPPAKCDFCVADRSQKVKSACVKSLRRTGKILTVPPIFFS